MKPELLLNEKVFLNRSLFDEAERHYSLRKHGGVEALSQVKGSCSSSCGGDSIEVSKLLERLHLVESENKQLKGLLEKMEARLGKLEGGKASAAPACAKPAAVCPAKVAAPVKKEKEDDDDVDLFGDDDEDEDVAKVREERLKAYADKKAKKGPGPIAKSSVTLDVKPWDDETDMKQLENSVRTIVMDGLVWGGSKLVPVAFGVKKLQIQCVIEDDKVSTEALEEKICEFEDYVQSVDIAAFNKI